MTEILEQLLAQARIRRALPEPALRRLLRQRAGLSQQEIARALGVNRVAVTRYENGQRTPRGPLGVTYAQLLERLAQDLSAKPPTGPEEVNQGRTGLSRPPRGGTPQSK